MHMLSVGYKPSAPSPPRCRIEQEEVLQNQDQLIEKEKCPANEILEWEQPQAGCKVGLELSCKQRIFEESFSQQCDHVGSRILHALVLKFQPLQRA